MSADQYYPALHQIHGVEVYSNSADLMSSMTSKLANQNRETSHKSHG